MYKCKNKRKMKIMIQYAVHRSEIGGILELSVFFAFMHDTSMKQRYYFPMKSFLSN